MKTNFILTVSVLLAASSLAIASTNDLPTLLQRGLFEEEANHQLDAAIGAYKEAIEHFDHDRQLAATAIFRLGECYRKLGRTNEANSQYERIVREFPDQAPLAQLSRAYLPPGGSAAPASVAESSGLPPDEEKFLREVQESVQNSPDLVNGELFLAAQRGYVSAAEFLLAHGADVNLKSPIFNQWPLQEAAGQGNEAMVRLLLSHGAAVNSQSEKGDTALSAAVDLGYITVCRALLDHGADVNLHEPILTAALQGNDAMVQLLLSHGAAVNSRDNLGRTPLFSAVHNGFLTVCHTLVAQKADVNAKDNDDWTPLHLAAELGKVQVAEFLAANKAQIDAKDNSGWTPLQVAVDHGQLPVAEFLITNKAQIDAKTALGKTSLLIAMSRDDTNMVKLLLDSHADANIETSVGTSWQLTHLGWAIYTDRPDLVKVLLEGHADPNALVTSRPASDTASGSPYVLGPDFWNIHNLFHSGKGAEDWEQKWPPPVPDLTPLLWAVWGHSPHFAEIVKLLLEHGANPNSVDSNGQTALFYAILHVNLDAVRALIAHGADVNVVDKEGRPPLAVIGPPFSETGRQIEELLIKSGADADYNRRRGIWVCDAEGTPKSELFLCPTNSINHYTLLEALATLYNVFPSSHPNGPPPMSFGHYGHLDDLVPFPDFARVSIHRLDGKRAEVLHVNVEDMLQSGDRSKDVALQAGDLIEISKQEHKVADRWFGLSEADVDAFNKCLLRTVRIITQGHTNDIALLPAFASAYRNQAMNFLMPQAEVDTHIPDWLAEATKSRKADTLVRSLSLNNVLHDDNVLLNTWDLSKVRLTRGGAKMTFDLTSNPSPDVWLEDGDVIEIPELGEAAPAPESK